MKETVSKSEKKRIFKRVEAAAIEMADLSNRDLGKLPDNDEIKSEVMACRGLKGGARKRQIKYLAKIMRQFDVDEIFEFLDKIKGTSLQENKIFHEAERLRDILINDALESYQNCLRDGIVWEPHWQSDVLDSMVTSYPEGEVNEMRKSIYQYVKSRNRLHYRELFRIIKATIEFEERKKKVT